uniref:SCAN box domain-containing protein n=1 Tax=Hucho hucho TaxID=62062 RepID=A0A4W5NT55_9TELE
MALIELQENNAGIGAQDQLADGVGASRGSPDLLWKMRFREAKTKAGESPQELFVCLRELARRWIPPTEHTLETVRDVIVLELFLLMITSEIRVWVWERDPKSAAEAARLAEVYMSARQDQQAFSNTNTVAAARPSRFVGGSEVLRKDNAGHIVRHNTQSSFN